MSDLPLAVVLSIPAVPHRVGAPIPVSIEVKNISDRTLWMIGVMDGSELGLRYPHYQPRITGSQPLPSPEPTPLPDMVAPLRIIDFRQLAPGEGFDPTDPQHEAAYLPLSTFVNFRPPSPGRYEFRLTISTESRENEEWLGIMGYPGWEAVVERLAEVPRLRIESNVAVAEVQ